MKFLLRCLLDAEHQNPRIHPQKPHRKSTQELASYVLVWALRRRTKTNLLPPSHSVQQGRAKSQPRTVPHRRRKRTGPPGYDM